MSWEQWLKENTNTVEETEYRLNESKELNESFVSGTGTLKNDVESNLYTKGKNVVLGYTPHHASGKSSIPKGTVVNYSYNQKNNTTQIFHHAGDDSHQTKVDGHFSNHINENGLHEKKGDTEKQEYGELKHDVVLHSPYTGEPKTIPKGTMVNAQSNKKTGKTFIHHGAGTGNMHMGDVDGHHTDHITNIWKESINESSGWQTVGSQYGKPQLKHDTTLYDSHGSPTVIAKGKHVEVSYHADKDMTSLSHTPDNRSTPLAMGQVAGHFTNHVH